MKKYVILSIFILTFASLGFGIVAPENPNIKFPAEILNILEKNPNYFMPGTGYSKRMQLYKEAKLSGAKAAPVYAYVPVICIQYADLDQPEYPASDMSNQLFDTYKTFSTGSMKKYYDEVSYGQFDFNGEILTDDWIKVSRPSSYWNIGSTSIAPELIREALDLIDDYTDFRKFDLDGVDGIPNSGDDDGTVDNLIAIHSGVGGESGGQEIWSHSWSLYPAYVTDDIGADGSPIIISGYVIQPATTTTNQMEGIEVFCHEFGHALGLPDLYDRDDSPEEESEGVGEWCIMSANTSHDESPAHFSAWCKEVLGWVNPIILDRNMYDVEIPPVEKSGVVYKVWTKGQIDPYTFNWGGKTSVPVGREYFLIENRQKLNFDKELPGEGLLIWHVRNDVTRQNDDENYKLVDLEAADNRFDLDSGRNNGDDGDPFPGSTQNNSFNRISYPNSNSFYDDLSKVAIENITMNDTLIYADLHIFAPDLEYRGNSIDDSSGDENGFVDPGETVDISLTLKNFGADLASMTFTLSISDTAVFIIDSISIYNDILYGTEVAETDDKFTLRVKDNVPYHPIKAVINATDGSNFVKSYNITIMMENLKILVVDDAGESNDNGFEYINYYTRSLTDGNIPYYDIWQVNTMGSPTADDIAEYRTLIWVTGSKMATLDSSEQTILTNFLKDENSLFLSGQNVGEDLVENGSDADSIFYSDVLKAAYLQDGPGIENVLATGIEKDPVSNAFTPYFFLNGGNSESNQVSPDILGTVNGSVAMINYFGTGLMGKQAAIRYEDENYKLIYSAFGLEGINEIGTNNVSRQKLMINSILWLQGIEETVPAPVAIVKQDFPSLFKLGVNYPNPFNATTVIPLSFFNSGNFVFSIFNISGKLVFQKQVNVTKASTIEISWDGRNNFGKSLASGMYLYQIRSDNGMSRSAKMILMK